MVKCIFSFLIALICLVTGLPAEAARNDNYPTPLFCYVLSNGRVTTYVQNSTARVSGYIDGGVDQVQLNNIYPSDNWVYGGYPTSRGRKWAWFRVSDVIYDYNYQMKKTKALRNALAYRKKERGQTIGSVYANDVIYVVSEYGDLAQIIYPINGGYKLGWVEKSVVDWGSRPAPQPGENYPTGNIVNVSNGTYKIASAANLNMVLDLDNGRNENGANLHLWQWVGTPQQKFVIENCGNGYYSIRPSYTDKKLDGLGSKPNNGTNVGLWTSNGSNEQRWRFIDAGNGYVYIESKMKPGLSLDCQGGRVQNGVNVQVWMRGNVPWNKWKLERIDTQLGQSAEKYVVSTNGATLALRSGPGTQYGITARMPRGSVVEVYSISNGWANLSYNGTRGYASAQYLKRLIIDEKISYPLKDVYVCGNNWGTYYSKKGANHLGIDIKSRSGDDNVYAVADGKVVQAGCNSENGNTITLQHSVNGSTFYTFYAHLASIRVSKGTSVTKGQGIGVVGNSGLSSKGKHLHFAITTQCSAGTFGYGSVNGNVGVKNGYKFYNPHYVIENNRLP